MTDVSASYRRKDKTSLQIRTADGDVVRLKFTSMSSAQMSAHVTESGDTNASELELQTRQRTKISMSVHGELDADELAAIQETIGQVGDVASDFFNGDIASAFESASDLGIRSDEIASVNLRMKSSERLTYSASSVINWPPIELIPLGEPAAELPVFTEAAAGTPTLSEPAAGPPAFSGPVAEPPTRSAPDEPATEAPAAEAPTDAPAAGAATKPETVNTLRDFLAKLMENPARHAEADAAEATAYEVVRSVSMSLKLQIFESVLYAAAPSERPSEPLPQLVSETIDDLVAQEQPAMEAVA